MVILGDVNPALLSAAALQNLADFVDQPGKGGALVLIAGPTYMPAAYRDTPLARLLPFDARQRALSRPESARSTEGFVVQPTDLGLASPGHATGRHAAKRRRRSGSTCRRCTGCWKCPS